MGTRAADWIAWGLHFVVGAVIGWFSVLVLISKRRGGRFGGSEIWLSPDLVLFFQIGGSLALAGVASLYGDKLWIGQSYRVIPPDGVEHSKISKLVSWSCVSVGIVLMILCLVAHFGGLARD